MPDRPCNNPLGIISRGNPSPAQSRLRGGSELVERHSGLTPRVMAWGAISYHGRSNLLRIEGHELDSVYGDSAPSFTTVKVWASEFKRGRKSMGDIERSGRPITATTDENIGKVHQMVLDDRRIKVREIAEVMNLSKERVCHILNQHLGIGKLSTRWVSRLLTLDPIRVRMSISNALLLQFRRNKSEFWHRLITVDETWIHHYTSKTEIQYKQWIAQGEPAPKKAKTVFWLGK
ncbi:histone-lysine N-methyltransferase SETMAR [Trichonephila clavipes]|nr:histone-lysine N-methyltransferase SETMAR [Trichonephila clavipes]